MNPSRTTLAALALAASTTAGAHASDGLVTYEQAELVAGDGLPWDRLGASVAVSGDLAAAGAPWCDDAGSESGAVYVYLRTGVSWSQEAKLVASDAEPDDRFGTSVALFGERLVVGSPFDDDGGANSGAVYVFVRNAGSWQQEAKLTASDAAVGDQLGGSVSIDGDTLAAGAMGDADAGSFTGSAYVFVRSGSIWSEQAKLLSSVPAPFAYFGTSIAIDADLLAVGADGNGRGAFVYERSGVAWGFLERLTDGAGSPPDRFGSAVAVGGERVAVGAPFDDDNGPDSGSVLVFLRGATSWDEEARLVAGESLGELGGALALDGDLLVAGARSDHDLGLFPVGAAYVFQRGAAGWGQEARLVAQQPAFLDELGASVAIAGDTVVLGAPSQDAAGASSGAAHVFHLVPGPSAFCFGDGSGAPCPCGNQSAESVGCLNSLGLGARLAAQGLPSVTQDSLVFEAENLLPNQPALLFAGENAVNGGAGVGFGDGLRCAGGNVVRLGVMLPDGAGAAAWGPGLTPNGGWAAGDTRRLQAWYRDPTASPCGFGFNLSNGLEVVFVP